MNRLRPGLLALPIIGTTMLRLKGGRASTKRTIRSIPSTARTGPLLVSRFKATRETRGIQGSRVTRVPKDPRAIQAQQARKAILGPRGTPAGKVIPGCRESKVSKVTPVCKETLAFKAIRATQVFKAARVPKAFKVLLAILASKATPGRRVTLVRKEEKAIPV